MLQNDFWHSALPMPYSNPPDTHVAFPSQGRPGHRRSYSHITTSPSYTSSSASLNHLPRRRPSTGGPGPSAVNGVDTDSAPRKAPTFQLGRDDDDDSSADEAATKVPIHDDEGRALPPLRLKMKQSPFDVAVQRASPPPQALLQPPAAIPFPRSSPTVSPTASQSSLPFPQSQPHTDATGKPIDTRLVRPSVSRTSSSPIMLSNGKPLKSSLKSSSSSPNIPFPPQSLVPSIMFPDRHQHHHSYHQRAQSAPSTPLLEAVPFGSVSSSPSSSSESLGLLSPSPPSPMLFPQKNVHFPSQEEGGLTTVRVFNRSAKPASLSRLGEETETETEGESSASGWGGLRSNTWGPRSTGNKGYSRPSSYNFPVVAGARQSPLGRESEEGLSVDVANSTPVPARGAEKGDGNVYLESVGFERQAPQSSNPKRLLTLTGTMLVRNVTYQKTVAIRFTLDDWHTTNDVVALHEKSLRALPARFVRGASGALDNGTDARERVCSPYAVDSVGDATVMFGEAPAWDRFRFFINLEDYADSLETRTMWLVGRYSAGVAPGSAVQSAVDGSTGPVAPAEWWDNNMGSNYRVAFQRKEREVQPVQPEKKQTNEQQMHKRGVIVSAPSVYSPVRPTATSPPPKSYPAPPQISASVSLPLSFSEHQKQHYADQKQHQAAMTQSTMARLKKLNLMNYAAPAAYVAPSSVGATRADSTSSIDSTSSSTSTDSTPLLTPTQANDETEYVQKGSTQDVDVNVLQDDAPLHSGSVRPSWGAASTRIALGMALENGFPATLAASSSGETTPTPMPASVLGGAELGSSPPFSSMAEMGMAAMKRGNGAVQWPWSAFGGGQDMLTPTGAMSPEEEKKEGEEELTTPPLSAPVVSLLSDIKERSGLGQIAPPQRRKGAHHLQDEMGRANFTVGGGSPSSSGSESGSTTIGGRRGAVGSPPSSIASTFNSWGFRPGSPRPAPAAASVPGTASPPHPGSPKRFLSPLPGGGAPSFPAGTRSPTRVGARSPLRLSPVNSSDELGAGTGAGAPAGEDMDVDVGVGMGGGGVTSPGGQDDAIYQAFVRQWCFAQAPGPTVGASVGGNGAPGKPAVPKIGINV